MPDYLSIARRALERPEELAQPGAFRDVLKGFAIELWGDAVGRLFIVADEDDARRLRKPRGSLYTPAEERRVVQIGDPAIVLEIHEWKLEIHEWKRTFDGRVREQGGEDMSRFSQPIDLTQVPAVPWAWVDERVYAAIRGCRVKVLQNERRLNIGCPFRRINGTTIRYKLGDITAFMESQPGGGGAEKPWNQSGQGRSRPRRIST